MQLHFNFHDKYKRTFFYAEDFTARVASWWSISCESEKTNIIRENVEVRQIGEWRIDLIEMFDRLVRVGFKHSLGGYLCPSPLLSLRCKNMVLSFEYQSFSSMVASML
ncbi:hypothetical protein KFK09_021674 [Dendrobium nobile]|uniref:Uncharacterized protein n=1 Tax=Dendrobium nobile TaxID=94219 RepID=A0A8T3ART6_DENNO|nr:hypothetical protein KFK09_021674 [Dendrobium nobile]